MKQRNTKETHGEWRRRMMRETEGLTKPGDVLAHLAADSELNGAPPQGELVNYEAEPPKGAKFCLCPIEGQNVDGMDPCEGCPGHGPECGAQWSPPEPIGDLEKILMRIFVGHEDGGVEEAPAP